MIAGSEKPNDEWFADNSMYASMEELFLSLTKWIAVEHEVEINLWYKKFES